MFPEVAPGSTLLPFVVCGIDQRCSNLYTTDAYLYRKVYF